MNGEEFRDLVRRMRNAQKQYFQTRERNWLNLSKKFEREVDKELANGGQQSLFD